MEQKSQEMWENYRRCNRHFMEIPGGEGKEQE